MENAREAILKLEANVEATGLEEACEVVWADVQATLDRGPGDDRVDLVFLDPPYNVQAMRVRGDLELLVTNGFLSDEGKVVVHRPAKETPIAPLGLQLVWDRDYGQSRILVFSHEPEEEEG